MRNLIVVFGTEKVIVITRGVIIIIIVRIMKWPVVVLVIVILLGGRKMSVSHPFLRTKIGCIKDSCAPQETVAHIS
jgi:hypothetical protein